MLIVIDSLKARKGRCIQCLVWLGDSCCRNISASRPLCLFDLSSTNRIHVSNSYTAGSRSNMNMLLAEHIHVLHRLRLLLPARLQQVAELLKLGSFFANAFFAPLA
jgi:hypothetical protein